MITAKGGARTAYAVCTCDSCGIVVEIACPLAGHEWLKGHGKSSKQWIIDTPAANRRLHDRGWRVKGKIITCPACLQKLKSPPTAKEPQKVDSFEMPASAFMQKPIKEFSALQPILPLVAAPATAELRQPTREQKRQIIDLLNEVYDTKASRYTGAETDVTVANVLGGGILFGWVAQIREDLFGPAGGNAEIDALRAELEAFIAGARAELSTATSHTDEAEVSLKDARTNLAEFAKVIANATTMATRLDRICKSLGPKGAL